MMMVKFGVKNVILWPLEASLSTKAQEHHLNLFTVKTFFGKKNVGTLLNRKPSRPFCFDLVINAEQEI